MRTAGFLVAILALSPAFAGCLGSPNEPPPDVMASFYPLFYLTSRIAEGAVTVDSVVSAQSEPHDWDPSPREIIRIGGAKVLVIQGMGFEPWLATVTATLGDAAPRLIDSTADLDLDDLFASPSPADRNASRGDGAGNASAEDDGHSSAHGSEPHEGDDPHTWLDPVFFAAQAEAIARGLAEAFPEHAETFDLNLDAVLADLEALDSLFWTGLASCTTRTIVTSHDAFGHLARRYDFEVLAIAGLSPDEEPDAAALAALVEAARDRNVTVVFFEELVSPRVAQVVAAEIGAETRLLSPLESLPPADAGAGGDYVQVMRSNLANLRVAMRCT